MKKPKKDDANADLIKGLRVSLAKAGGPSKQFDILIHTALGLSLQDDIPPYTETVEAAMAVIPPYYTGSVTVHGKGVNRQHRCLLRNMDGIEVLASDGANAAIAIVGAALLAPPK